MGKRFRPFGFCRKILNVEEGSTSAKEWPQES